MIDARDNSLVGVYVKAMDIKATDFYRLEEDWEGVGQLALNGGA